MVEKINIYVSNIVSMLSKFDCKKYIKANSFLSFKEAILIIMYKLDQKRQNMWISISIIFLLCFTKVVFLILLKMASKESFNNYASVK